MEQIWRMRCYFICYIGCHARCIGGIVRCWDRKIDQMKNQIKPSCLWGMLFALFLTACQPNALPSTLETATPQAGTSDITATPSLLNLTLLSPDTPTRYRTIEFAIKGIPLPNNPFA